MENTITKTRKVFVPILVGEELKVRFNKRKGSRTAEEYIKHLMKLEKSRK